MCCSDQQFLPGSTAIARPVTIRLANLTRQQFLSVLPQCLLWAQPVQIRRSVSAWLQFLPGALCQRPRGQPSSLVPSLSSNGADATPVHLPTVCQTLMAMPPVALHLLQESHSICSICASCMAALAHEPPPPPPPTPPTLTTFHGTGTCRVELSCLPISTHSAAMWLVVHSVSVYCLWSLNVSFDIPGPIAHTLWYAKGR